ncbi:hypothetical protein CLOM_g4635, partial [Closterium sp. NIES-68]
LDGYRTGFASRLACGGIKPEVRPALRREDSFASYPHSTTKQEAVSGTVSSDGIVCKQQSAEDKTRRQIQSKPSRGS